LRSSRNEGLLAGIAAALIFAVPTALITGLMSRRWLGAPLLLAIPIGVTAALANGLVPWFYHYCVRIVLARKGLIPLRLRSFLDWCSAPERLWLYESGGSYQFRHRQLMEHIARDDVESHRCDGDAAEEDSRTPPIRAR
jgi:hypothetical protein